MKRRNFLIGCLAGLGTIARSTRVFANDPPLNDLKRSELLIGTTNGTVPIVPPIKVVTWEMNFEEDDKVLFFFRLSNAGSRNVRIIHIQPWMSDPQHFQALWKIVETLPSIGPGQTKDFYKAGTQAAGGWRADNDSNGFLVQIEKGSGIWDTIPVESAQNGWTDIKQTVAHMEWHNPEIHFEVRSIDRR